MSYLVLARKYRPQTFADMAGQQHVVRTLQNALSTGRVAHAFLFTGARGVGKTTCARLLAKALNCEKGPTPEPCGVCPACTEIAAGTSVDVLEIDGASNNGVDQVRELRDNARYLPSRDRHKIYIIDEVHMLSGAAFNALLKTLEEPPPHVKFIFATTEPHKIPVTILSRTQRYDFRRIPLATIVEHLGRVLKAEGVALSDRAVTLVARQAEGSMRDAQSLLDQVLSAAAPEGPGDEVPDALVEEILGAIDRTAVAALAGALIDGDAATALTIVGGIFDRGLDLKRLAEDLAWHLRNLMVVQVGGEALSVLDVPDHERAALDAQASTADPATLAYLFDVVHGAAPEIGRAIQPRLALEVALLKAIHLAPGADVTTLLDRVEALAAGRMPQGGHGGPSRGAARPAGPARGASRGAAAFSAPPPPASEAAAPASPEPPGPAPQAPVRNGGVAAAPASVFERRAAQIAAKAAGLAPPSEAESEVPAAPPEPAPAARPRAGNGVSAKEAPKPKAPAAKEPPAPAAPKEAPEAKAPPKPKAPARPEPAAPPAGGDLPHLPPGDDPAADLGARFAALVDAIARNAGRPFIAAALEHARPMEIGEETLTVALERGFYHEGLGSAANRRVLESLVSDHFARALQVRLEFADAVKLDGLPEAIAKVKERELAEHVERLRTEARENPSVRLAQDMLGGEIEDIRILGE